MKATLIIILSSFLAGSFGQTTWLPLNSGTTRDLTAVSFPTTQSGFVVGEKGTVLKTTNSGLTWAPVFSDTVQNFVSVSFPTPFTGYVASDNKVYKTTNGGSNWQVVYSDTTHAMNVIHFINDSIGFIGSDTAIFKTVNHGASWTFIQKTTHRINTIAFPSPSTGYFTGGASFTDLLYKTTNQGASFTSYTLGLQVIKERIFFINDSTGYLTGWYAGCLSKTTNGGLSWTQVTTTHDTQGWDVYFKDPAHGFYIDNSGGTSRIYSSSDGGVTWQSDISTTIYNTFYKFTFTSSGKAYAVGVKGAIHSTQIASSISEIKNPQTFKIYPNPSSGNTTIESSSEMNLSLFDELGRSIKFLRLSPENGFKVNLTELANGIYFLSGKNENEMVHQKITVLK